MGERLQGTASPFSFPNIILLLWCLSSMVAGRNHRRPDFCDKDQPESKREPKSFLWAIKRDPPSYFFGTIHVPYTRVWDYIPENTKRAFELAERVYFELDLTDPSTITALTKCQLLPNGQNLSEILPRDIYVRLKHHMEYIKQMIPTWLTDDQRLKGTLYPDYLFNALTGNWERKRPVWVMLMVNSLTESDIKSRGVPVLDLFLAQEADKMNKLTGAVEKVKDQCDPLNGLNLTQILFALNQTLTQHERLRAGGTRLQYTTDDLIKHYNCGDLNTVIFNQDTAQVPSLINASLLPYDIGMAQQIDKYFREELISQRNNRMGQEVANLLLTNPNTSFFFAFGAGHFIGDHTVLDVVQSFGFEVEHISIYHKVKHHKHRHRERERTPTLPELSLLKDFSMPNALDQQNDENRAGHDESGGRAVANKGKRRTNQGSRKHLASSAVEEMSSGSSSTKNRQFKDLWVRLRPTRVSRPYGGGVPHEKLSDDAAVIQNSLRVWYGLPNRLSSSSGNKATSCMVALASLSALFGWFYTRFAGIYIFSTR